MTGHLGKRREKIRKGKRADTKMTLGEKAAKQPAYYSREATMEEIIMADSFRGAA